MNLQGYRCKCKEVHYQNAGYYVSVANDTLVVLAAGPFAEHDDALAMVKLVNDLVLAKYNPEGRAHWYGFGTTAMSSSYRLPGKLNPELGLGTESTTRGFRR